MRKCDTCEYEKICEMPDFVRNNLKLCKTYTEKRVRTNADRIRAMNNEELAEWILSHDDITEEAGRLSKEGILNWLNSPINPTRKNRDTDVL